MKLAKYLKPYWLFAILSPLTMLGEVFADLQQPKLMQQIIDEGIMQLELTVILEKGILMILLVILGGVCGLASAAFASAASQGFATDLRCDVFSKIMSFSPSQTDSFTTGSLITRTTNDISATQDFVSMAIRMFVRSFFLFFGGVVMTLGYGYEYGLVILAAMPFQIIALWLILSKASPLYESVQKKLDRLNSIVGENVSGTRVVKAYVREGSESDRFNNANDDLMTTTYRVQKINSLLSPLLMIVQNFATIAILYIGGKSVNPTGMQPGMVMAAVTYSSQILMSMMMVAGMFQSVTRAKVSSARICEVLDTEPEIKDGNVTEPFKHGGVSFKNVSFKYESSPADILKDINIDIKPGEHVAIMGMTGCGKSTLVSLIPRFYDACEGEITVDGVNVKDYSLNALRGNIAFALQKSELFSGTVSENIRYGNPDATDEEVQKAARIAQADGFIRSFKDGYDTVISEKGASLSGGQKQRIAIARAIVSNPKIIIFDDSTSALDLNTEKAVRDALRENLKDATVITVAQRIASVINEDKIFILENGTVTDSGTHARLLETSAVYRDIYDSQMKKGAEL